MEKLRNFKQILKFKLFKLGEVLRTTFCEFCESSSVNGVRYITERRLHWSERIWWIIAIAVSLWMCGSLIHDTWVDWRNNLTNMKVVKDSSISTIPFPTVTICPNMMLTKNKFNIASKFTRVNLIRRNLLLNLSDSEKYKLRALTHVCPLLADRLQYTDEYMNESIFNTIENLSMNLFEFVITCGFYGSKDCLNKLVPVFTDEGLCFTYNNLNSHEIYTDAMAPGMMIVKNNPNVSGWSLDSGYTSGANGRAYPIRRLHMTAYASYIALNLNKSDNSQCKEIDEGIKVILSVPGDPLLMSRDYYRVPLAEFTALQVHAKITTTSESVRHYAPSQRQCFYSSERQLKFFKNYTENNCKAECLANFTKMECGCVKFSMPRDKETKICGRPNIICYRLAEKNLRISDSAEYFRLKCNCMPGCTSIEYTATLGRTDIVPTDYRESLTLLAFILMDGVQVMNRRETYTWTDFLSILGGFLGLFLGMSALSVVEVVYYSTLRLFWTFRRLKTEVIVNESPIVETISKETIDDLDISSLESF